MAALVCYTATLLSGASLQLPEAEERSFAAHELAACAMAAEAHLYIHHLLQDLLLVM